MQVGTEKTVAGFLEQVSRESGVDVQKCYQCGKCTAGCPTSFAMDNPSSKIMHLVQLGLKDQALRSKSIWLCVGCETCTTRCPKDLDVARVMKTLCGIARREGIRPDDPEIRDFHESFLHTVKLLGRAHELGMMTELKLRSRKFLKDIPLGIALMQKGKLTPLVHLVKDRAAVRRVFEKAEQEHQRAAEDYGVEVPVHEEAGVEE